MRDLDRTKKYDLSQLNDEQLQAVLDWLKENDKYWGSVSITDFKTLKDIYFDGYEWDCFEEYSVNALELFDEEISVYDDMLSLIEKGKQQGLKIVVTFEKL